MTKLQIFQSNSKNFLKPLFKPRHYGIFWSRILQAATGEFPSLLPIKTPEGFWIRGKDELVMYCGMFMEDNLKYKPLIADLKKRHHPIIIDVGAAVGMFCQWLGSINSSSVFYCFEPDKNRMMAGSSINSSGARVLDIEWVQGKADNLDNLEDISVFCLKIDTDGDNIKTLEGARHLLRRTKWLIIEEDKENIRGWMELNCWFMELVYRPSPVDLIYKNVNIV